MPIPSQTFSNIGALLAYINSNIIPNALNRINGDENNNALNGLVSFILKSMMNNGFVSIVSSGGTVVLPAPMNLITVVPTSIQWNDNFQNEYYIVNGTGSDIPLAFGYSYVDQYATSQTVIPARTAIHIAKATNGSWIQMNNIGGGGSGSLPPMTGHGGQFLGTDGTSDTWESPHISITSANFEVDGVTYLDPTLNVTRKVSVFLADVQSFIYISKGDWQYVTSPSVGLKILLPGFNAHTNPNYLLELFFKGINDQ